MVWASIYDTNESILLQLLKDACTELRGRKGDISLFSHYKSFGEFADHIEFQIDCLPRHRAKMDAVFKAALGELYEIFLPTSDWDEAGGSLPLANQILAILKSILG